MEGPSFDRWTRRRATAINRRSLLGVSLTGGIGAALGRIVPAAAQFSGNSCTFDVTLVSSLNAGQTASGTLTFDIGTDGAIDKGSLTLAGQAAAPVVGQAMGPAIDLLAALADGTTVSLTGVSGSAISSCNGPIIGTLANADNGQIGTWSTNSKTSGQSNTSTSSNGAGQSPAPTATQPPSQGQDQTGGGGGDSGGGGSTCLELHSQCNASSACCSGWCTDNECRTCGDTICGEDCIVLSDNLAHCGACFNACNTDTETCVNGVCTGGDDGGGGGGGCVDLGGSCGFSAQCCSGWCNGGVCDSCGMVVCNDLCVDTSSDNNNCGNCNNLCIGTTCQNGSCQ
jgi:hypothetical protein